ncbi:MAG: tetratricopeptide repeat protein [Zoogloea sp.]|nr:tetratricopeptide repeat protein [Zoogloea sp.]
MPFIGIGFHILLALFFAIHAVRTGREMYWLLILFMFPLFGSIVYLFAVYLPDSRLQHTVRKTVTAAARSLDPGRNLREAQQAFDLTPTAQNQMRLASAFLETGAAAQAVEHYESCLRGPFASDPEIRLGAARARLANGQSAAAIELAEAIRKDDPGYRAEQVSLLLAQAYGHAGRNDEARNEFASAVARFGSLEARTEFAIWALSVGELDSATGLYREIEDSMRHWNKHTRTLNKAIIDRLESAFSAVRRP